MQLHLVLASAARDDFVDGRYRNTSFATLFPDGMRRLLANALTEDDDIKGWRVASTKGKPNVDAAGALTHSMGFTAWWPKDAPQECWPTQGRLQCSEFPSGADCPSGVTYCIGQPMQADAAFAIRTTNYTSVIDYMHEVAAQLGFYGPQWRGVY